jgi:cytochrome o ubiquinol oxidase subunit II
LDSSLLDSSARIGAIFRLTAQAGQDACGPVAAAPEGSPIAMQDIEAKRRIASASCRDVRGLLLLLLSMPVLLAGCGRAELEPAGPVGDQERTVLFDALAIMLAIVIPVIVATIWTAWWYRRSNPRARRLLTFTYSGRLELVIWSIPTLVVVFLGGIAWIGSHDLDPAKPLPGHTPPLEVEVVSLDWKWLFIYPQQGVASVNRLVVPAGVPLHLRLTSATVWNVFWVPQLGSMLYCMSGMAGTLWLQADQPGVYYGESAMISGDGFASMHFNTDAVTAAQFAAWVSAARAAGPVLDLSSYQELERPTMSVPPYTYRAVQPGLFEAVVLQKIPSEDGSAVRSPE